MIDRYNGKADLTSYYQLEKELASTSDEKKVSSLKKQQKQALKNIWEIMNEESYDISTLPHLKHLQERLKKIIDVIAKLPLLPTLEEEKSDAQPEAFGQEFLKYLQQRYTDPQFKTTTDAVKVASVDDFVLTIEYIFNELIKLNTELVTPDQGADYLIPFFIKLFNDTLKPSSLSELTHEKLLWLEKISNGILDGRGYAYATFLGAFRNSKQVLKIDKPEELAYLYLGLKLVSITEEVKPTFSLDPTKEIFKEDLMEVIKFKNNVFERPSQINAETISLSDVKIINAENDSIKYPTFYQNYQIIANATSVQKFISALVAFGQSMIKWKNNTDEDLLQAFYQIHFGILGHIKSCPIPMYIKTVEELCAFATKEWLEDIASPQKKDYLTHLQAGLDFFKHLAKDAPALTAFSQSSSPRLNEAYPSKDETTLQNVESKDSKDKGVSSSSVSQPLLVVNKKKAIAHIQKNILSPTSKIKNWYGKQSNFVKLCCCVGVSLFIAAAITGLATGIGVAIVGGAAVAGAAGACISALTTGVFAATIKAGISVVGAFLAQIAVTAVGMVSVAGAVAATAVKLDNTLKTFPPSPQANRMIGGNKKNQSSQQINHIQLPNAPSPSPVVPGEQLFAKQSPMTNSSRLVDKGRRASSTISETLSLEPTTPSEGSPSTPESLVCDTENSPKSKNL